jgi:hypothetical protein
VVSYDKRSCEFSSVGGGEGCASKVDVPATADAIPRVMRKQASF